MIPKVNEKLNKENIKTFKMYDLYDSDEKRHNCVLCSKKVSIDESFSNEGSKLICYSCAYKYFPTNGYGINTQKLREWLNKDKSE